MAYPQKVDLDTKFANWNGWYNDLFEEIRLIRRIGQEMLLDPKQYIHRYFAGILNLYSTHSSYIQGQDKVYQKLQAIKLKIYNDNFHRALARKMVTKECIDVMSEMITIFTWINKSFQEQGIIPKVTASKAKDPGKAMEEQDY